MFTTARRTLERRASVATLVALGALLVPSLADAADLKVVATLPALASLVRDVGGDHVEVVALASPNENPHYVDPRPNYVLELTDADLVVYVGMELEIGWFPDLLTQCRNGDVQTGKIGHFDASSVVTKLDVPTGKVERSQGDIHPAGNPHYLYDARAGAKVAMAIAERLAELDPANEEDYLERGDELANELERFARAETDRFAKLGESKLRIVSYHRSLTYLRDWLGLSEVATIEPMPGVAPDPGHVATVLSTMKTKDVGAIVQERYYPTNTADKLAELAGATVVVIDGNPDFDNGETYIAYLQRTSDALYDALD